MIKTPQLRPRSLSGPVVTTSNDTNRWAEWVRVTFSPLLFVIDQNCADKQSHHHHIITKQQQQRWCSLTCWDLFLKKTMDTDCWPIENATTGNIICWWWWALMDCVGHKRTPMRTAINLWRWRGNFLSVCQPAPNWLLVKPFVTIRMTCCSQLRQQQTKEGTMSVCAHRLLTNERRKKVMRGQTIPVRDARN
jgi:hypothetical protein